MRVGRPVGQDLVDVDEGVVAAAVLLAVDLGAGAVEVAGDLEIKIAEPLVEGHLQVLETLGEDRGVGRDGELLGRHAERGVGGSGIKTARGYTHRVEERRPVGVEGRQAALQVARDRSGGARTAGERHRIVLIIHDGVRAGERIEDKVVRAPAADAEGVGVRRQRRGPGGGVEHRAAVPTGETVVECGKSRLTRRDAVFSLDADFRLPEGLERRREERGLALVEILQAPAAAVTPHGGGAQGDLVAQWLVGVDGGAVVAPRADAELDALRRAVGLGALRGGGADAAERAVAKEDGVGPAAEVVALEVVAVAVVVLREKIPLRPRVAGAAGGVVDRGGEEILHAVVDIERARRGPLGGGLQVGDAQGVDEVARDNRVRHRRVTQVAGEAAAGQRTRGGETGVAFRADLKRREHHRLARSGLGRRSGRRGRCGGKHLRRE